MPLSFKASDEFRALLELSGAEQYSIVSDAFGNALGNSMVDAN